MTVKDEAKGLRKLWGAFWSSRVILTANNFRVFDHLKAPKNAEEIARILKADRRATEILLDALTGLGLLKKASDKYRNSATASRFLVKGAPHYQGDIIRHADNLWENWSGLDRVIKTGKPSRKAFDYDAFIKGMDNLARLKVKEVVSAIDLKGVKKALDVGGGPGTYCIELAGRGISATLYDLPGAVKIAKEVIRGSGTRGINFIEGDFLSSGLRGGYDLVFISQVVHGHSEYENIRLLEKAGEALNPGGRVAIHEFYLDKNRAQPPQGALFSVNMLVNTEGGRCYSPQEMKKWLKRTGFGKVTAKMLEDTVLVSAIKV